jgi:hypothetical protein
MANNAKVWTLQAKRFETPDVLSEDLGRNMALGKKDGVSVYTTYAPNPVLYPTYQQCRNGNYLGIAPRSFRQSSFIFPHLFVGDCVATGTAGTAETVHTGTSWTRNCHI